MLLAFINILEFGLIFSYKIIFNNFVQYEKWISIISVFLLTYLLTYRKIPNGFAENIFLISYIPYLSFEFSEPLSLFSSICY